MLKSYFKLVFLLFLTTYSSLSFAGGICVDAPDGTGPNMRGCHNGTTSWTFYRSDTLALWDNGTCDGNICTCGDANDADPCDGCGYISQYSASACHSSSLCSGLCTPVPELPETSQLLTMLVFFSTAVASIIFWNTRDSKPTIS